MNRRSNMERRIAYGSASGRGWPAAHCLIMLLIMARFAPADSHCQSALIMSFNIRYDNPADGDNAWPLRRDELAAMIMQHRPAVLGIQEGLHSQVEYLERALPGYSYAGAGRDDGATAGEYCAFFYDTARFDLLEQRTFWLSDTPERVSVGWDAAIARICTMAVFADKAGSDTLHVFNTHFDHMGERARSESAALLALMTAGAAASGQAVVLMGDLNATPYSDPVRRLRSVLSYGADVSSTPMQGPAGTFNGWDTSREAAHCIDYIFVANARVLSYRHIAERRSNGLHISDHYAVMAEIGYGIAGR